MSANHPAILGGEPLRPEGQKPYNMIGEREKAAVMEVLDSGELSGFVASPGDGFWGGPRVRALEDAFKGYFGVRRALAVNSATSALHCAVAATGVGPGDEVIVTPYTMSATATAILMTGAVPVFADVEDLTFGLDPVSVVENITPQTRGIMAVNLFGHPCRLDELRAVADRHGLFLIEDNAQAPDAVYHDRKTGTIGDAGIFSFNRHKVMQSGEGGVLVTDDEAMATKAALVRNHGEAVVKDFGIDDLVNAVGLNYRMTEIEAAIAGVQFHRLRELNARRTANAERLTSGLADVDGISAPVVAAGCTHVYYLYVMKYDAEAVGIPRALFLSGGECRRLLSAGRLSQTDLPRAPVPAEDLLWTRRLPVHGESAQPEPLVRQGHLPGGGAPRRGRIDPYYNILAAEYRGRCRPVRRGVPQGDREP